MQLVDGFGSNNCTSRRVARKHAQMSPDADILSIYGMAFVQFI